VYGLDYDNVQSVHRGLEIRDKCHGLYVMLYMLVLGN
jgi:hypothetical protein